MTKEIIDGINVAECEHHLSTGYCQLQMIFQGMVLKLPFGKHLEFNLCDKDCYYKQLKRLEQENEKLKTRCETIKKIAKRLNGKLHQENQELTSKLKVFEQEKEQIKEILNE